MPNYIYRGSSKSVIVHTSSKSCAPRRSQVYPAVSLHKFDLHHYSNDTIMAPLILTYFDAPGVAEPIRWALEAGNIEWEDKRVSREDFAALKPSKS